MCVFLNFQMIFFLIRFYYTGKSVTVLRSMFLYNGNFILIQYVIESGTGMNACVTVELVLSHLPLFIVLSRYLSHSLSLPYGFLSYLLISDSQMAFFLSIVRSLPPRWRFLGTCFEARLIDCYFCFCFYVFVLNQRSYLIVLRCKKPLRLINLSKCFQRVKNQFCSNVKDLLMNVNH